MTRDPSPGRSIRLEDRPLHLADSAFPGRLLVRLERSVRSAKRDELAALASWSRASPLAVVILPATRRLYSDLRALGFEDAGPLGRYGAPTAPGRLRRVARTLFAPRLREPAGAVVSPDVLDKDAETALRERYRPRFGALAVALPETHPAGVTVRLGGLPAGFAHFAGGPAEVVVDEWLAPPDDPDLVGFLARETLRRAGEMGIRRLVFETPHVRSGHGLVLGGFLPQRSRARVLVRDERGVAGRPPTAGSFGFHQVLEVETDAD